MNTSPCLPTKKRCSNIFLEHVGVVGELLITFACHRPVLSLGNSI